MQSGFITVRWAEHLLCFGLCRSHNLRDKNVANPGALCTKKTGCWWQTHSEQGGHSGRKGGDGEEDERAWSRIPYTSGKNYAHSLQKCSGYVLCRALSPTCCLCPALPLSTVRSVWLELPYWTENKLCKQCHLVGTQLSAWRIRENKTGWLGFTLLTPPSVWDWRS